MHKVKGGINKSPKIISVFQLTQSKKQTSISRHILKVYIKTFLISVLVVEISYKTNY